MTCPSFNGSGTYQEDHDFGACEVLGCPDCQGIGRVPDPCPACGQHGHAMASESGPGPLCSKAAAEGR